MATDPVLQPKVSEQEGVAQRYTSSWIDWLIAAITRLPGPSWLFYLLTLLFLMFMNNALQWMDGTLPVGTFDPQRTTDVIFPLYFVALMHYLNTYAGHAIKKFRPVTDLTDADYDRLSFELRTVPAWPALIAGIAGSAFILLPLLTEPATFGIFPNSSLITKLIIGALSLFWGAVLFVFIFHTVRQLNLVNQIYGRACRIDLFHLKPVYAFSVLTARSGIGLIFFLYLVIATNSSDSIAMSNYVSDSVMIPNKITFTPFDGFSIRGDPLSLIFISALLFTGIAAFILPLQGIHQRLVEEKEHKSFEVAARLTSVVEKLHRNLDGENFEQIGGIQNALSALKLEREELDMISTWPWDMGTLSGFVTAILIPVMLWLLTRMLERFI